MTLGKTPRGVNQVVPAQPSIDWFMESLDESEIVHCGHEPRAVPRRTKSADKSDALQTLRAVRRRPAVAKRLECVRLQRRFPKAGSDSMAGAAHGKPPSHFGRALAP